MNPQSIVHLFFEACDRFDKPDAVRVKEDGRYVSYSHQIFRQRVCDFGRGLMTIGLQPGEHVAIMAETRFEWAIADLGILAAGGIVVPIYPTLLADQAAWIVAHSDSVGAVVSTMDQAEKLLSERDQLPKMRFVIVMDTTETQSDIVAMADVEDRGQKADNETAFTACWQGLKRDDVLTIVYTSGTTGHPKGVILTHDGVLHNLQDFLSLLPFGEQDTHLSNLPLSHIYERAIGFYCMLFAGVTIAYAEDIKMVPVNLAEVRPTLLVTVPRLYEKIYDKILANGRGSHFLKRKVFNWTLTVAAQAAPYLSESRPLPGLLARKWSLADKWVFSKVKAILGGNVKIMVTGSAPLAKEIVDFFNGIGLKMIEGLGMTEASPVVSANLPNKIKPGTVGPAFPSVEIKIADDGEILVRGPNVMRGYYKNPEATAATIVDGWLHTGDVGHLDEDGYLTITDRKKDLLITSGGKNVAPGPIENALKLSPLIENAVAIGDRRKHISALLVPPWETVQDWATANNWPTDPDVLSEHPPFLDALAAEVKRRSEPFANYERVKKFRVLKQPFTIETGELTPSMKVKRKVVTDKFTDLIDSMYE